MDDSFELFSKFRFGDMTAEYFSNGEVMTFSIRPSGISSGKNTRAAQQSGKIRPESMIQFRIAGDSSRGPMSDGRTMRNGSGVSALKFLEQIKKRDTILTKFENRKAHLYATHSVRWPKGAEWLEVGTMFHNAGTKPLKLEMISSFSLSIFPPSARHASGHAEHPNCEHEKPDFLLHRFVSSPGAEGRHECRSARDSGLGLPATGNPENVLRFGENSSAPVGRFFPFAGISDENTGITWGAQLAAYGPWRMEIFRTRGFLGLSGGLPDRESGAWTRMLEPGETFEGPSAVLSCVRGDWQELMNRLVEWQTGTAPVPPLAEAELPLLISGKALKNGGARTVCGKLSENGISGICVISEPGRNEDSTQFAETVAEVARAGFVPGLRIDLESCPENARPAASLKLDGCVIQSGSRRFPDFRNGEVRRHLENKLGKLLRKYRFGALIAECGGIVPCGCDGKNSPAQEIADHISEYRDFLIRLRTDFPQLALGIGADGRRLSPGWARIGSILRATADEGRSFLLPLTAANVQMLIPMRSSVVPAMIGRDDSEREIHRILSAAMIGRLCLRGDPADLDAEKNACLVKALAFYKKLGKIIADGKSTIRRDTEFWQDCIPEGYQVFSRTTEKERMIVLHTFRHGPEEFRCSLGGTWEIAESFAEKTVSISLRGGELYVKGLCDFTGAAIYLRKKIQPSVAR